MTPPPVAALALLATLVGCDRAAGPRPNVVLVTLDTTRADALGAWGNTRSPSPVLDQLAAEGIRFDRAYTAIPLTIPAHSTIFTGLYPPRHGVHDNGDSMLSDGAVTLAETLQAAGWATMASVGAEVTSHHWGFSQGFDAYFDDMGRPSPTEEENRWRVERRGDRVVDDALQWLDTHPTDGAPFLAWVHLFDAHHPYEPPEPFATQFYGRPYLGEVAFADAQLGRLVERIRSRADADRTWILVFADHGEGLMTHGEAMHGVLLYDETTRVPLVIRPPGPPAAAVVADPVSLVDLFPTVLDLAGIPAPPGLDGQSLLPRVRGGSAPSPQEVYVESEYAWRHFGWAPQKALVDDRHKLISSTAPEVYAREDVQERTDLASSDPALRADLQARLDRLQAALAPTSEVSSAAVTTAEQLSQLQALGYVTGGSPPPTETRALPDPRARLPQLARVEEARRALQANDDALARRVLEDLTAREPGLEEPRAMLALLLSRTGEMEAAIALVRETVERRPSPAGRAQLGSLLLLNGDVDQALVELEAALAQDPFLESAWEARLDALWVTGDIATLETETLRARELLPQAARPMVMEGLLLAQRGDEARARELLLQALARKPDQPFANQGLAILAQAAGRTDEVEERCREEIRILPANLAARRILVTLYADQRRYQEQIDELTFIAEQMPADPQVWHGIAQASFNLRRYPEAEEAVRTCRSLAPTFPPCAMLQANVLDKLGKEKEAWAAYREALALAGQTEGRAPSRTTPPEEK